MCIQVNYAELFRISAISISCFYFFLTIPYKSLALFAHCLHIVHNYVHVLWAICMNRVSSILYLVSVKPEL